MKKKWIKTPIGKRIYIAFVVLFCLFVIIMLLLSESFLWQEEKKEESLINLEKDMIMSSFFNNITDMKNERKSKEITLPFEITAKSVLLYDIKSDEIIYTKNQDVRLAPASLTKIMTAILVLEQENDLENTVITYKDYMGKEILEYGYALEDIAAYEYKEGEKMSVKDSLYLLIMRSTNDTANLLGEHYGDGDLNKFIEKMNIKAREIGANNTNFSNTHGLDHKDLYTTAYDMFLITKYALTLPEFVNIATSPTYTLEANNYYSQRDITNVLGIMNPAYPEIYYPYLAGLKSGYTDEAGRCLISTAKKDGRELLMVLMNVPIKDQYGKKTESTLFFSETIALYNWAFLEIK